MLAAWAIIPQIPMSDRKALAEELCRLKHDIFEAVKKRERVPQPIFWFLLEQRLRKIRQKKDLQRALAEVLGPETE